MFNPLEKDDPRFGGWFVRERPKNHYRAYTYLYWREGKKLRKQYVPLAQVSQVRRALRQERQRRRRADALREAQEDVEQLYHNFYFAKGYLKLWLRCAVIHEPSPDGRQGYHFPPESNAALEALIFRSLWKMHRL